MVTLEEVRAAEQEQFAAMDRQYTRKTEISKVLQESIDKYQRWEIDGPTMRVIREPLENELKENAKEVLRLWQRAIDLRLALTAQNKFTPLDKQEVLGVQIALIEKQLVKAKAELTIEQAKKPELGQ